MNTQIVITGTGLITPLGNSVEQTWRALLAGEFIRDHARVRLDSVHRNPVHELAIRAARQAIESARWGAPILSDPSTALVVGTSKGPIECWINSADSHNPANIVGESLSYGLAELASSLANDLGLTAGPHSTLSAACASGLHALLHATLLLKSDQARRVLVVASEASIHPLFIGSFKRLGVLPREGVGCRPFDLERDGFLISEAAASVCLEHREDARDPLVAIDRIAIGGDATHLTGSDPTGRTLKYLLNRVIDARPVDLVHAHATGTVYNDPIELAAIESTLPSRQTIAPHVFSHKGAMGHALGAASLVSVVLNAAAHRIGVVPPNIQTRAPFPTHRAIISHEAAMRPIGRSIVIASGFGGAIAAGTFTSV